tara:strand:+ start:156 stop:1145 length:990 start_codon:yes stop_codon:yes gene_type:complete
MFNNSKILITGGTGSFGKKFLEMSNKKFKFKKIIIFSRDEMKQWDMSQDYLNDNKIKFVIGDVRDYDRLNQNMKDIDFVVHAAATKIVPTAEYNPFECVKTNINGAMNVINAAKSNKVKKVVALSTDKASNPVNLYGATKLAADKLFIAANSEDNKNITKFGVVRYGNVMGSRGSVIPYFHSLKKNKTMPITDIKMTRFMISLEEGVKLVWDAFMDLKGGEIYVKKIPSMKVIDIAKSINPKAKLNIIGIRPGEKIHEQMIGSEDAMYTYEYKNYFKILPSLFNWNLDKKRIKNGKKVSDNFVYSSNNNNKWMTQKELKTWIKSNLEKK